MSGSQKIAIVTRAALYRALLPYCLGWGWATDAIDDLWKLGAPVPNQTQGPVRRIILPTQFAAWWKEVTERRGISQSAQSTYNRLS